MPTKLIVTKDRDECGYIYISVNDYVNYRSEINSYVLLTSYSFYGSKEILAFCEYTLRFFGWNENFTIDDCKSLMSKYPHLSTNINKKEQSLFYKWDRREKEILSVKAGPKAIRRATELAWDNPGKNVYVISKKGKRLRRFLNNYGTITELLANPMTAKQQKKWDEGKRYKWLMSH